MSDVYRIGVSIAMHNGVSSVLGIIAKDLLGVQNNVGKLEKGFSRLKLAIGGIVAIAAGAALIGGVVKVAEAAEELSRVQGSMAAAGIQNRDIARATASAWTTASTVMGTKVADNLTAIAHLRASFGSLDEAIAVGPAYMRNAVALGAITKKDGESEAFKLAQAIHLSGAANDPTTKRLNPELFAKEMHLYTSMIAAGQGKITAGDLLAFQKQAGSYGGNLTDEGRMGMIGYIQAMGGQKAGTSLATTNRALKDGMLQKASLATLESVGLIDPSKVIGGGQHRRGRAAWHEVGGKWDYGRSNAEVGNGASPGGGVQFRPGALKNEKDFLHTPMQWVYNTVLPALQARGLKTTEDQINWVQHAKLTTNVTRLLAEGIRNQGVDTQEASNVRQATKSDQYKSVQGRDLGQNIKNLSNAWHNFMTALGAPLIPIAIRGLKAATAGIQAMTKWAVANPKAVVMVAKAAVILGAALVGFGVVAVGIAAFAAVAAGGEIALVIAGVTAILSALTAFVAFEWGSVAKDFDILKNAVGGFFGWLIHGDGHPGKRSQQAGDVFSANMSATGAGLLGSIGFKPPPKDQTGSKTGDVYMDGRKVGKIVASHLVPGSAGQAGNSTHDASMSPMHVGQAYVGR
jgi:hypothetical protein